MLDISANDLGQRGQKTITLGDLMSTGDFEVVNPDLPIFTVTKPMTRRVEIKVALDVDMFPSEHHVIESQVVNEIILDSIFPCLRW